LPSAGFGSSDLPELAHHILGQREIALGVELRRVSPQVAQDGLTRFQAELAPDLGGPKMAKLIWGPNFDVRRRARSSDGAPVTVSGVPHADRP